MQRSDRKITITGDIGSGKSAITRILEERLGYKSYSTGMLQRQMAGERGLTTLELNLRAEKDGQIDATVDSLSQSLAASHASCLVDSRMAWYFIPASFKIYLLTPPHVAAERILQASRKREDYRDLNDAERKIRQRQTSEVERFRRIYGVDYRDSRHYDLIVDTASSDAETLASLIVRSYESWRLGAAFVGAWLGPRHLYPTQGIRSLPIGGSEGVAERPWALGLDATSTTIQVVRRQCLAYVLDGHKRISYAIRHDLPLVPVVVVAEGTDEVLPGQTVDDFVRTSCKESWLSEWEDYHEFTFFEYPDFIG